MALADQNVFGRGPSTRWAVTLAEVSLCSQHNFTPKYGRRSSPGSAKQLVCATP